MVLGLCIWCEGLENLLSFWFAKWAVFRNLLYPWLLIDLDSPDIYLKLQNNSPRLITFFKFCNSLSFSFLTCSDAFFLHDNSTIVLFFVKLMNGSPTMTLREKCQNTVFFLVRILFCSDWIQENTDQKKLRI